MLESIPPELLDEWRMADELDHLLGQERLIKTVANSGMAICGSQGMEVEPWQLIPGEEPKVVRQSTEEQISIARAWQDRCCR